MTGAKAISKAMAVFKKAKLGDIRTVELMEGSGSGDMWVQVVVRIGYSVNGDYSESDKKPFEINVVEKTSGEIVAERIEQ